MERSEQSKGAPEQVRDLAAAIIRKDEQGTRMNWVNIVVLILALLYGLSPIDLIPDIAFPVGVADDGIVFLLTALLWFFNKRNNKKPH